MPRAGKLKSGKEHDIIIYSGNGNAGGGKPLPYGTQRIMTSTDLITYSSYALAALAVWVLCRCARSMLRWRYEPELWGYFELPGGTSAPIRHWECILGRAKASDIVLTGDGIERSHAAVQRSGDGEWTVTPLSRRAAVKVNGKAVTEPTAIKNGDRLRLGESTLRFLLLTEEQRGTLQRKRPETGRAVSPAGTLFLVTLFQLLLLLQHTISAKADDLFSVFLAFALLIVLEWACYFFMRGFGMRGFEPETLAFFLTSVGFSVAASAVPGQMLKQCLLFAAALLFFVLLGLWLRDLRRVRALRWCAVAAALLALGLNLVLSERVFGAKNWLSVGGFSLQPSEFVKIAYIYAGAATLDRLFHRKNLIFFIAFSAVCVGALALMGDFGTALVFFCCFLVISFMRSGSFATVFLAVTAAALAGLMVLTVRPYVAQRFATFGHAWADSYGAGYQQTRAMSATAAGGLFGRGAGAGWLKNIVAADTDLVFGVVTEELGLIVAACCLISLVLLAVFAVRSAAAGRSSYYVIASCAAVTVFLVQTALNVFGSLDLLPFTGVTLPFVSRGGSSLISCWALLAYVKAGDTRRGASFALRTSFETEKEAKTK